MQDVDRIGGRGLILLLCMLRWTECARAPQIECGGCVSVHS